MEMPPWLDNRKSLLLIPCSATKRSGGEPEERTSVQWPPELIAARREVSAMANLNERRLMPAWLRYEGNFYKTAQDALRDAVAQKAPLLILSGGYGLLHPEERIGDYNKPMCLSDWPPGLLEELLIAEARRADVSSVVAFAARSSDYAKLVRRTPWKKAKVSAFLVTIEGVVKGASRTVPSQLGEAFTCFWQGRPADSYPDSARLEPLG